MPRDLLINGAAGAAGPWTRVEPAGKKTWPFRLVVDGNFAGDSVIIEELVGGLPPVTGPLAGNPGTFGSGAPAAGNVNGLYTIAAPQDIQIDAPIEYIRARLGAAATGTATVRLVEAE